jgi:hypothetical protein
MNSLERPIERTIAFIDFDLAGHVDEPFVLRWVIGTRWFISH